MKRLNNNKNNNNHHHNCYFILSFLAYLTPTTIQNKKQTNKQKQAKHNNQPNVDFLRAGFVPYDLGGHPCHGSGEGHLGALVGPLPAGSKVTDLYDVILRDENAGHAL